MKKLVLILVLMLIEMCAHAQAPKTPPPVAPQPVKSYKYMYIIRYNYGPVIDHIFPTRPMSKWQEYKEYANSLDYAPPGLEYLNRSSSNGLASTTSAIMRSFRNYNPTF